MKAEDWKCPYWPVCRMFCDQMIESARIHECKGVKAYENFLAWIEGKVPHYEV